MNLSCISVIIPTYNEDEVIEETIKELKKYGIKQIIVVDGGSKDNTLVKVKNLGIDLIDIGYRSGYGDAFIRGLSRCTEEFVCKINADDSFDPIYLNEMLTLLKSNKYDVVFNSRYLKDAKSFDDTIIRKLGNFLFTNLCKILFFTKNTDILYNYHMSKKINYESLKLEYRDFSICTEIPIKFHKLKYKIHEIPSIERSRKFGVSKVNAFYDGLKILLSTIKLLFIKI